MAIMHDAATFQLSHDYGNEEAIEATEGHMQVCSADDRYAVENTPYKVGVRYWYYGGSLQRQPWEHQTRPGQGQRRRHYE